MTSVTSVSFHNVVSIDIGPVDAPGPEWSEYSWRQIRLTDKDGNQVELTIFGRADQLDVKLTQEDTCETPS